MIISCRSSNDSRGAYNCMKSGFQCSAICLGCNNSYENILEVILEYLDEDDPQEVDFEQLTEKIDPDYGNALEESCELDDLSSTEPEKKRMTC